VTNKNITYNNILIISLLGPSIISVLFGIFHLNIPVEMSIYVLTLTLIFFLKTQTNKFNFIALKKKSLLFYFIFLCVFIFFVLISISPVESYNKLNQTIYLVIAKIIVLSFISYLYLIINYTKFLLTLKKVSLFIITLYFILFYLGFTESIGDDDRVYLVGIAHPIWFSRFLADLIFIILFVNLYQKKFKFIDFVIIIFGINLLMASGSRGPALALVVGYMFFYIKTHPKNLKIIYPILFILFSLTLPYIITKMLDFNIYSVYQRLDLYELSLKYIISNPWGYGIGSFGMLAAGEDIRSYPHNIFLEIFIEMGIFGFLIFTTLIIYGFKSYERYNLFFYLFLIAFINAQVTGDIPGNSYMFVYLFLSIVYQHYHRKLII
jgi:O-antigen ligase